ncbi:MAG: hypothetical protein AB9856_13395 [Cellulosilyticaceae bacterium]
MKNEYDLKKIMNEQMKQVKLGAELEEAIRTRCLAQTLSKEKRYFKSYKGVSQVAALLIGIILVFSGTAYAMNHIEGFNYFIDKTILQKIAPHVQTINKGDGDGKIKMVVEAAIADHYNSLLVFSFINQGKEPWNEGVKVGRWHESWTNGSGSRPPILSDDGKKLTYYVEGHGDKDILQNKKFQIKAHNLINEQEIEEVTDIPLGELFKAHGIVLDTINYGYESNTNDLYMKLDNILKKKIGNTQRIVLKKNPKITFEYVGMIQDSKQEDPRNPDGGLTIYTRNSSNKYWTNTDRDYTVGTISEVTDIRTGKVYEANMRAIEYDVETLWRGALGVSQFNELMDPSEIPYLKATKVIYEGQKVIANKNWKVNFQIADTTTSNPIKTELHFTQGNESITVEGINCSVFRITLTGTKKGNLEDLSKLSIYDKMVLKLKMKDGSIVNLQADRTRVMKDTFIASYRMEENNRNKSFIDVEQIESIIINKEEVMVP